MHCSHVQKALSSFLDGELDCDTHRRVLEHMGQCVRCEKHLAHFQAVSSMLASHDVLVPSAIMWQDIRANLDKVDRTMVTRSEHCRSWTWYAAIAASIMAIIGTGWFVQRHWPGDRDRTSHAAILADYLDEFRRDPTAAQQALLARYEGIPVSAAEAIRLVGFEPLTARGLPPGYTVAATHVLRMPCCNCVQTICRWEDGSTIAVFEHEDNVPLLDARTVDVRECASKICWTVEGDGHITASWQCGPRHLTVVGLQDEQELSALIAWMDR